MKLSRSLFSYLALLATTTGAFAAAPATKAPPTAPAPAAAPATHPVMFTSINGFKLDDYIKDLTTELKLSDTEKQQIEGYCVADGVQLQTILNDDTLSPLQQAQEVSNLRDVRNAKIEALLNDWERQREFPEIEARYRVALTELAADGGLVAAAPPAAK
jgi:hypothetical protein